MIKAIIFDYDGTLADRTKATCTAFRIYLQSFVIEDKIDAVHLEAMVQDLVLWDEYGAGSKRLMVENSIRNIATVSIMTTCLTGGLII